MVFLALVSILILILVMRFAIDTIEGRLQPKRDTSLVTATPEAPPAAVSPPPETAATPRTSEPAPDDSQERAARAAAVAVAIFMSEETEQKD